MKNQKLLQWLMYSLWLFLLGSIAYNWFNIYQWLTTDSESVFGVQSVDEDFDISDAAQWISDAEIDQVARVLWGWTGWWWGTDGWSGNIREDVGLVPKEDRCPLMRCEFWCEKGECVWEWWKEPTPEVCDKKDNNGNGQIDEGLECDACSYIQCDGSCSDGICSQRELYITSLGYQENNDNGNIKYEYRVWVNNGWVAFPTVTSSVDDQTNFVGWTSEDGRWLFEVSYDNRNTRELLSPNTLNEVWVTDWRYHYYRFEKDEEVKIEVILEPATDAKIVCSDIVLAAENLQYVTHSLCQSDDSMPDVFGEIEGDDSDIVVWGSMWGYPGGGWDGPISACPLIWCPPAPNGCEYNPPEKDAKWCAMWCWALVDIETWRRCGAEDVVDNPIDQCVLMKCEFGCENWECLNWPKQYPTLEICDGIDNDLDGEIDEDEVCNNEIPDKIDRCPVMRCEFGCEDSQCLPNPKGDTCEPYSCARPPEWCTHDSSTAPRDENGCQLSCWRLIDIRTWGECNMNGNPNPNKPDLCAEVNCQIWSTCDAGICEITDQCQYDGYQCVSDFCVDIRESSNPDEYYACKSSCIYSCGESNGKPPRNVAEAESCITFDGRQGTVINATECLANEGATAPLVQHKDTGFACTIEWGVTQWVVNYKWVCVNWTPTRTQVVVSTTTPTIATWEHCEEIFTNYDTYLSAYYANPGCDARTEGTTTVTTTVTWEHCENIYEDYSNYLSAYYANPSCTAIDPVWEEVQTWSDTVGCLWEHCGDCFEEYSEYRSAYTVNPSCSVITTGVVDEWNIWEHCGEEYNNYDQYLDMYYANPSCGDTIEPSGNTDLSNTLNNLFGSRSDITNYQSIFQDSKKTEGFNNWVNSNRKDLRPNRVEVIVTLALDKHFVGKDMTEIKRIWNRIDEISTQKWQQFGMRKSLVKKIYQQLLRLQNLTPITWVQIWQHLGWTINNVVNSSQKVQLLMFDIRVDEVSPVILSKVQISAGGSCAANFDDKHISKLQLWRGDYPTGTLISSKAIPSNGIVDFDIWSVLVTADSTQRMYATVDLIKNSAHTKKPLDCITAKVTDIQIKDDEGKNPVITYSPSLYTPNIIYMLPAWKLEVKESWKNNNLNNGYNILWGEDSDFIAAFDLNATNEDIRVEDMKIEIEGQGAATAIQTLTVYSSDQSTRIYGPTAVTSNTVNLNNIDFIVPQNRGETIYVKIKAEKIGNNEPWVQSTSQNPDGYTISLVIPPEDAVGMDSWENMSLLSSILSSWSSDPFQILPVDISSVQFVSSVRIASVDNVLSSVSNVGILRIIADTWTNTDTRWGDLDLAIQSITFDEDLWGITTSPSYTLRKVSNNQDGKFICSSSNGKITCPVSNSDDDFVLEAWEVADYVIEASWIQLTPGDDSIRIQIDSLSSWAIVYGADDTGIDWYALISDPKLENEQISSIPVTD